MSYSVFVLSFSLFLFLLQCSLDILMLVFVATVSTHCINYGLLVHDCRVVARVSLCLVQSNRASICLFVCLSVCLTLFLRVLNKSTCQTNRDSPFNVAFRHILVWPSMYVYACMYVCSVDWSERNHVTLIGQCAAWLARYRNTVSW